MIDKEIKAQIEEMIAPQTYNELAVKILYLASVQCSLLHNFTSKTGSSQHQGYGWGKRKGDRDLLCIIWEPRSKHYVLGTLHI